MSVRPSAQLALAFAFLLTLWLVAVGAIVMGDKDLFHTIGTGILTVVVGVAGFYFGTSLSSQKKDETFAKVINSSGAE